MPANGKAYPWKVRVDSLDCTPEEYLARNAAGMTDLQISQSLTSLTGKSVSENMVAMRRGALGIAKTGGASTRVVGTVDDSPFARYDAPPEIESNLVLVLPDVQAPYQHSAFLNNVLDLANRWKVKDCILAGDVLENSSLTHFDPAWIDQSHVEQQALPDDIANELIDLALNLPRSAKEKITKFIEKKGRKSNRTASGAGQEWHAARIAIKQMCRQFDRLVWIMGNHEGRLLRQIQSPMLPNDISKLFLGEDARVQIAPYYYCKIHSAGETWRVIHPKSSGRDDAQVYASKYLSHVIMAHSHHLLMSKDRSGRFWAISTGCCVDEDRLPYAAQRDTKMHRHLLGATIIRNGKAWLLHEESDWGALGKLGARE